MVLEFVALGALIINLGLIGIIIYVIIKHGKTKVDPIEYEMMEHEDPEKLMMLRMMKGEKSDDLISKMMMRDMIHSGHKHDKHESHESSNLVGKYAEERGKPEGYLHDKDKIRGEIHEELKDDLKDIIKKELRKKLNS